MKLPRISITQAQKYFRPSQQIQKRLISNHDKPQTLRLKRARIHFSLKAQKQNDVLY
ncbi:MAG: hypothetical protein IJ950_06660 [Helicobacter sp.]|nr:hypothetical protein [Helicobacter sp.]